MVARDSPLGGRRLVARQRGRGTGAPSHDADATASTDSCSAISRASNWSGGSLDHLIGKGEQRREGPRGDHPFSLRLSSLRNRQFVPSETILLGLALIKPPSRSRNE